MENNDSPKTIDELRRRLEALMLGPNDWCGTPREMLNLYLVTAKTEGVEAAWREYLADQAEYDPPAGESAH